MNPNDIKQLIDVLIPGDGDIPSGNDAGVFEFLNNYYRSNWNAYFTLINGINELSEIKFGQGFSDINLAQKNEIVSLSESTLAGVFSIFRDDCFKGYFAHPRWRNNQGENIWSKLGYRPLV